MAFIKTAIVTGATGAIGQAIAMSIAQRFDYKVALACRNPAKGEALAEHALVNNAAIAPREREVTDEGIERQLAVPANFASDHAAIAKLYDACRFRLNARHSR